MTPRTLTAVAALLALAAPCVQAETVMTVTNTDNTQTFLHVTDASEVTFGTDGTMQFLPTDGGTATTIALGRVKEIVIRSEVTGVESVIADADAAFRLRTNPVTDVLDIIGDATAGTRLDVFSIQGAHMAGIADWHGETVDVSSLTPGLYILKINNQNLKFIKK